MLLVPKRVRITVPLLVAIGLAASPAFAQHNGVRQDKPKTPGAAAKNETSPAALCPVTGKPIDRAVFVRFRGKRVYFADKSCIAKFRADPSEYAEGLKAQWKALRPLRVQATCPVTGEPIDRSVYVETPERDIYFASAAAKAKWVKDATRYREKLDSCYTFQTHCGTCAGDFDPRVFEDYEGRRIYFCCPGCRGVFQKTPMKFIGEYNKDLAANKAEWLRRRGGKATTPTTPTPSKTP